MAGISDFINQVLQLQQLKLSARETKAKETQVEQQGRSAQTGIMQAFAQTLASLDNPEARRAAVRAFAGSTGVNEMRLMELADTVTNTVGQNQQALTNQAVAAGAISPTAVALPALTGQTMEQATTGALTTDFIKSRGQSVGAAGPSMFNQFLSRQFTGMDRGAAANSDALAAFSPADLQQFARIRGGTAMSAQDQASYRLGLGGLGVSQMNAATSQAGMMNSYRLGVMGLENDIDKMNMSAMLSTQKQNGPMSFEDFVAGVNAQNTLLSQIGAGNMRGSALTATQQALGGLRQRMGLEGLANQPGQQQSRVPLNPSSFQPNSFFHFFPLQRTK